MGIGVMDNEHLEIIADCFVSVSLGIPWCVVELVYIAHSFNTGLLSLARKVLIRKYPDHK